MSGPFLEVVKARHSYYTLAKEAPISDSKIEEIVQFAVLHAPSTYNVQSARAVILFRESHDKFWDIVNGHIGQLPVPEAFKIDLVGKVAAFKGAYGTVLWFEDQETLKALGEQHAAVVPLLQEFSDHSSGIHQFVAWAALEAEGLGANLQHFNFHPGVKADAAKAFDLPESWTLKAQLVFGKAQGGPERPRTYEPIESRVLVKG